MFKIVLIAALVGAAVAQQQYRNDYRNDYRTNDHYATITRSSNENQGNGFFNYGYEASNGIRADAQGFIKNPNAHPDHQIQVITGSYSYYGTDGQLYTVDYIADENGFQPQGAHLAAPYNTGIRAQPYRPRI
ncbi:unnamed protein product [Allacma fusca]|uniref:Uncharacterized protein n=1 Tax=Allacma fusca TaxID=39272 RepID=A0A8J2JBI3_9HEXA|nr:unnamed protein product [Allacma fusca]